MDGEGEGRAGERQLGSLGSMGHEHFKHVLDEMMFFCRICPGAQKNIGGGVSQIEVGLCECLGPADAAAVAEDAAEDTAELATSGSGSKKRNKRKAKKPEPDAAASSGPSGSSGLNCMD